MLGSLKEKLQNVQGNLSSSLRGITLTEDKRTSHERPTGIDGLNLNAGIDILERYQENWVELRLQAQENAKKATEVDDSIGKLLRYFDVQCRNVNQVSSALSRLPEVIHELDCLNEQLVVVDELFITVEKSLLHLQDLIETRELQEKQLGHRFQLALYKEKKLSQLEATRLNLAREHAQKVAAHEVRQQRVQQERQEAFEQQFKQDLSVYKETHAVPQLAAARKTTSPQTTLEEVDLHESEDALNDFLLDDTPASDNISLSESLAPDGTKLNETTDSTPLDGTSTS